MNKLKWIFLVVSISLLIVVTAFAVGAGDVLTKGTYKLVGVFAQVVSMVRSSYVEDVGVEDLETGAMAGLVEAADPGGSYFPEDQKALYEKAISRDLPPYGLVLGSRSSYPFVVQVLAGSPAAKAGIEPGELIESINSKPVRARPGWVALLLLDASEHKGEEVSLAVIDRRLNGKRLVKVKASPIAMPLPQVEVKGTVPIVSLANVDGSARTGLETALIPHETAPAIVVDLRGIGIGNPKGAAELAVALAGGESSVKIAHKGLADEIIRAKGAERTWRVIVCIDHTSRGASELLAVALKARGATLVGTETYGDTGLRKGVKGAGGEVWIAQAWGLDGQGKPILGKGVAPDEVVRGRQGADGVMERALELAREKDTEKKAA